MFKITVTRIEGHPDGTTAPTETEIFRQVVENFDLGKFVVSLNKPTRTRKAGTRKTEAPKSGN